MSDRSQRVDDFDGTVILTAKFHAGMDEALVRRFKVAMHFSKPESWLGLTVWRAASFGHARFVTVSFRP